MTFDRAKFEQDVLDIVKGSPMADLLGKGLTFDPHDWSGNLSEVKQLAVAIVASVEIVKANLKSDHPGEDWNHISIETAAKILRDSVVLPGFWGILQGFLLGPVLRGILEGALSTFRVLAASKDWLALARAALALAA